MDELTTGQWKSNISSLLTGVGGLCCKRWDEVHVCFILEIINSLPCFVVDKKTVNSSAA